MTLLWYISTPRLNAVSAFLARLGVCLGLRVAIANEVWRREELENVVASMRGEVWRG